MYNRHVSKSVSAKRSQIGEIDQGQHNSAFIRGHEQGIWKKQYLRNFTSTVIVDIVFREGREKWAIGATDFKHSEIIKIS